MSSTTSLLPASLAALVAALEPDSYDSWLILKRVADRSGQTYAQVMACTDGGYLVEHRAAGRLGPVAAGVGRRPPVGPVPGRAMMKNGLISSRTDEGGARRFCGRQPRTSGNSSVEIVLMVVFVAC